MSIVRPQKLTKMFASYEDEFRQRYSERRQFSRGDFLVAGQFEPLSEAHFILSGSVVINSINEAGEERRWSRHGPGAIIPLHHAVDLTLPETRMTIRAECETETIPIPKKDIEEMLRTRPEFATAMCDAWMRWCTLVLYEVRISHESVLARTCGYLLMTCDENGSVNATHQEIADSIGASRESVSRALSSLKRTGTVRQNVGAIEIMDYNAIIEYAPELSVLSS